jgi:hypothetical protein
MNKIGSFLAVLLISCVGLPQFVNAVSPSPIPEEREETAAKGIKVKGETVCLFQSGTVDVRKTIGIGDVLIVYQEGGNGGHKEIGKIRVISYEGEDYIKGEVVEGRAQTGDVAKKGTVASLVISTGERCK